MARSKRFDTQYDKFNLFGDFERILGNKDLIQMVNCPTWSRVVNNSLKQSTLDHVYLPVLRDFHAQYFEHFLVRML